MNSIDLLKGIFYTHLKPEPTRISESLGTCLGLLHQHNLFAQILRLTDLSASPLQKAALEIIRKWTDRNVELINLQSGAGEDRNRAAALVLFAHLLSHSSFELMHSHRDQWVTTLMNIINRKAENHLVASVASVAMAQLIVKASQWDQMRREVLKDSVYGGFMNALVKRLEESSASDSQESLKALYIVLKGNLKSRIPVERVIRVLLRIMDESKKVIGKRGLIIYQEAARCVPLILDSGSTWAALLEQIVVALHHILENLYIGFEDESNLIKGLLPKIALEEGETPLILDVWKTSARIDVHVSLHRVIILSHLLQCLLAAPLSFTVDAPVVEILIAVRHLILLDGSRPSSDPSRGLSTADLLVAAPVLHQSAYLILETLLRQFKSALFPFVVPICDLVAFEIGATRNSVAAPILATSEIQSSLHRLVSTVFEIFKTGSVGLAQTALTYCLEDLRVASSSSQSGITGPDSALAMRLSAEATASAATGASMLNPTKTNPNKKKAAAKALSDPRAHVNAEALTNALGSETEATTALKCDLLRLSAMECIVSALTHLAASIGDEMRSNIDKTVIGLCITMARNKNLPLWRRSQFEPAFANPAIRKSIYEIVLASSISTGRLQTPILPYAAQYLTVGSSDPDSAVSSFCSHAISVINCVIHPRIPLLPPTMIEEQRSSGLSTVSVLAHQSDQLLLQQQEEKTLLLLQRTQGRRAREEDGSEDMDDDRPTKRSMRGEYSDGSMHKVGETNRASNLPSFLDSVQKMVESVPSHDVVSTASTMTSTADHTVLFKSAPKKDEKKDTATSSNSMAVDGPEIVDDGPDSEDEE